MPPEWADNLNFAQRQRLQYFESMLIWEGQANRVRLSEFFGLTKNHLTRELTVYRKHRDDQIKYDPSERAYVPRESFEPLFATGSAEEYLSLLRAHAESDSKTVVPALGSPVRADMVARPRGTVDRSVLTVVVRAIQHHHGAVIRYQSLTRPKPRQRTIWPHALVSAGERWHVRAFDELSSEFRDFVLARITKANSAESQRSQAGANPDKDCDWHEIETVEVVPTKGLSEDQKKVIAQEYGMQRVKGGLVWRLEMRRCLVPYFLAHYRLDTPPTSAPSGQQIDLKDPSLRERLSFDALRR